MASPEVAKMFVNLQGDLSGLKKDFAQAKRETQLKAKDIGRAFRDQYGKAVGQASQITAVTGLIQQTVDSFTKMAMGINEAKTDGEALWAVFENIPLGIGGAIASVRSLIGELSGANEEARKLAGLEGFKRTEAGKNIRRETIARTLDDRLELQRATSSDQRQVIQNRQQQEALRRQFATIAGLDPTGDLSGFRGPKFERALEALKQIQGGGAGAATTRTISLSRTVFGGGALDPGIKEQQKTNQLLGDIKEKLPPAAMAG